MFDIDLFGGLTLIGAKNIHWWQQVLANNNPCGLQENGKESRFIHFIWMQHKSHVLIWVRTQITRLHVVSQFSYGEVVLHTYHTFFFWRENYYIKQWNSISLHKYLFSQMQWNIFAFWCINCHPSGMKNNKVVGWNMINKKSGWKAGRAFVYFHIRITHIYSIIVFFSSSI